MLSCFLSPGKSLTRTADAVGWVCYFRYFSWIYRLNKHNTTRSKLLWPAVHHIDSVGLPVSERCGSPMIGLQTWNSHRSIFLRLQAEEDVNPWLHSRVKLSDCYSSPSSNLFYYSSTPTSVTFESMISFYRSDFLDRCSFGWISFTTIDTPLRPLFSSFPIRTTDTVGCRSDTLPPL